MPQPKVNRSVSVIAFLFIIILIVGYIAFPVEDEDTGPSSVDLTVYFDEYGELHQGNLTIWDDGVLVTSVATENGTTTFKFRGISGENQTILSILTTASEWGNFSIGTSSYSTQEGIFIESIAGVENHEARWEYTVNGTYGVKASDLRKVSDGDTIAWVYS